MTRFINLIGSRWHAWRTESERHTECLTHILPILMLCIFNIPQPSSYCSIHAESTALFISDNRMTADSWAWVFSDEMGLKVEKVTSCYGCRLKSEQGMSDDVARILSNRTIGDNHPDVILLQLGCNDTLDTDASLEAYARTLFDFPHGKVCNSSGGNVKNKNIAVSKNEGRIRCHDFAGSLCKIIGYLRQVSPDSRIFLLAPTRYGSAKTSDEIAKIAQMSLASQLFCLPLIESSEELMSYRFVWNKVRPHLGNMLLIGDSYCFTRKWTAELEKIADVKLTNLGKTSATLKERGTNRNTLGAQIARIPADCHPDIVLLEGGINDDPDPASAIPNYPDHISNLKRTNFAGALAYLVKSIRARFPDARIYAVTPGGLYYGHTDRPFDFIVKANQIRQAAELIGIRTIDWDRSGRLSFVFNNSKGTGNGTEASPFIYNVPSSETGDLLHPNERGGRYLAECAVARLIRK